MYVMLSLYSYKYMTIADTAVLQCILISTMCVLREAYIHFRGLFYGTIYLGPWTGGKTNRRLLLHIHTYMHVYGSFMYVICDHQLTHCIATLYSLVYG